MDSLRILAPHSPRSRLIGSPDSGGRTRRQVLRVGLFGLGFLASGSLLSGCPSGGGGVGGGGAGAGGTGVGPSTLPVSGGGPGSNIGNLGPLQAADANGLSLPSGFSSRIVARSSERAVPGSSYAWHPSPDGGATFVTSDGGWIYVSNSETDGSLLRIGCAPLLVE